MPVHIYRMQIWQHESEISQSSIICFENISPENSCFVVDMFCFISILFLFRVAVFLNATRRDRDLPLSPLRENSGSVQFVEMEKRSS